MYRKPETDHKQHAIMQACGSSAWKWHTCCRSQMMVLLCLMLLSILVGGVQSNAFLKPAKHSFFLGVDVVPMGMSERQLYAVPAHAFVVIFVPAPPFFGILVWWL